MDPLTLAAAGMASAGKLLGGFMANSAARARGRALDDQARQALREAGVAAQVGLEEDERLLARTATLAASNAGGVGAGRVLADLERQSSFKARNSIYRGKAEAQNARREAQVARTDGRNALIGAAVSATSSLLGSYATGAEDKRRAAAGGGRS